MPNNKSNASTAGLVGLAVAGGALVGGACYAIYGLLKNQHQPQAPPPQPQPAQPQPQPAQQLESDRSEETVNRCPFCDDELITEGSIELLCGHSFHKTCLHANYILHMGDREGYRCRICSDPVPEFILNGLAD